MALDTIIMDGDQVIFLPTMGAAVVVVQPGKMIASGKTTINGTPICIDGDEKNVEVPGCTYISGAHVTPGSGTLKIDALAGDQLTKKTKSGGTPIILKGSMFTSKFEVQSPAQDPTPVASGGSPIPDAKASYSGKGQLISANIKFKAT